MNKMKDLTGLSFYINKVYETDRLILKVLDGTYAEQVLDYYIRNKNFLKEWEPKRSDEFYTVETHENQLKKDLKEIEEKRAFRLWIFKKGDTSSRIIGTVAFNHIIWGSFLSCIAGYKLDNEEMNKGYITEALRKGIDIMFNEYKLHRIEANILPRNTRSLRVVEKLGFYNEGTAFKYLNINGKWEDHIHMVLRNETME